MNGCNQRPPLDHNIRTNQLRRDPNFIEKIVNIVRNVIIYLLFEGSQAVNRFFWGERAADFPLSNVDNLLLTTMTRITQYQIDEDLQCYICLDEYTIDENVMKLSCGHLYHQKCVTRWLILQGSCPVCREYFCPGVCLIPEVSPFRSVLQRLCRTIKMPFAYLFPNHVHVTAELENRELRPMYRLIRAPRATQQVAVGDVAEIESRELIEDFIFCHVMFIMQNSRNEIYPDSIEEIIASILDRVRILRAILIPGETLKNEPEFPKILRAEYLG